MSRLSASTSVQLMKLGSDQPYRRGQVLMHSGERGEDVAIVLEGRAKVMGADRDGNEVLLDFGFPGDLFGEMSVISGELRMATVVALERMRVRRIAGTAFDLFVRTYADATLETLIATQRRLRNANRERVVGHGDKAAAGVARRLVELVDLCGVREPAGWRIDLPLPKREMAKYVPTSAASFDGAMKRLRAQRVVATSRLSVVVTDLERLIVLAERAAE